MLSGLTLETVQHHNHNQPRRQWLLCTWRPGCPLMSYVDHIPRVPCQQPSLFHKTINHTQHMHGAVDGLQTTGVCAVHVTVLVRQREVPSGTPGMVDNKWSRASLRPADQEVAPVFLCRQCAACMLVLSRHGSRRGSTSRHATTAQRSSPNLVLQKPAGLQRASRHQDDSAQHRTLCMQAGR